MNRMLLLSALVLVAVPAFAQDAQLGRLFLTPEQRAALDNARRNKIRAEAVAAAVVKTPKPPSARTVLINGVVKRSDGETIVWVNGKPVDGETPDGMQFQVSPEAQGSVMVREPDKGRRVEIKVGQQVDLVTGRVQEPFERRQPAAATSAKPSPATRSNTYTRPQRSVRSPEVVPEERGPDEQMTEPTQPEQVKSKP